MSLRDAVPWWGRMGAKLLFSSLPVSYQFWSRINLFRHGKMDSPDYALDCFQTHWQAVANGAATPETIVELGPGDSLATALIARAHGVRTTFLVDAGAFASRSLDIYLRLRHRLLQLDGSRRLPEFNSVEEMLNVTGGRYLTEGTASLRTISDDSVDLVYSHATLEHVPLREVEEQLRQTRRILRPSGIVSHQVDLRDHLGGGLNNLRFSEAFWESPRVHRSGFYTNRIRLPEYLEMFRDCGFMVRKLDVQRWDALPLKRRNLDRRYRSLTDDDLRVSGFRAVLMRS